ncbi:MAG: hypothetical protein E6G45_14675 [Actinobacteria bacterium]|nr:MAG: hypothetical protein E6G45_14675 [Actinomycetota bacterium]
MARAPRRGGGDLRKRFLPWALVAVAALVYPAAMLTGGLPRFPSRGECVHPAKADGNLEAVFGRFDRRADAERTLQRVLGVGFKGSAIEPDGCGRLKVDVHGVPSLAVGRELVAEAAKVGVHATLEEVRP